MSAFVPVLAEVNIRAWGLDDPRTLRHLRYENQPGPWRRTNAIEARAADAGWPQLAYAEQYAAATAAARRLECDAYHWNRLPAAIYDEEGGP